MPPQPILLQLLGEMGPLHSKPGSNENAGHVPNHNVTDVSVVVVVEPGPDVAVHALVIPDVPPADSHPWS
jgi:hypothetical protein